MLKVAITGNIASGKSTAENILSQKGFKVLDTDEVTHSLLLQNDVKQELARSFKDYDIFERSDNGSIEISRPKLGKIVFDNTEMKQQLEAVIHPKVKDEIINFFNQNKEEQITFVAVPLLFEAKMIQLFDKIILIYSDDNIRINRLKDRNNISGEDALKRLKNQDSQDEKASMSDYVIYNNQTIESFEDDINRTLEALLK